jgi:hypothetical protein
MNNALKSILAISATAFATTFAAGGALAQEATPDSWTRVQTSATVEQVRAEAKAAQLAGNISYGEATRHGVTTAQTVPLSRAQVVAEAREAMLLGLVGNGEGPTREVSPQQAEQIKLAGLRASGQAMASR